MMGPRPPRLPSLPLFARPSSTRRLVVVTYRRIDRVGGFGLGRCGNCAMKDPSSKCAFYRAPLKERPQMPRCSWTISRPWESNREGICKGVFGDDLYLSHIASCSVALMKVFCSGSDRGTRGCVDPSSSMVGQSTSHASVRPCVNLGNMFDVLQYGTKGYGT